MSVNVTTRSYNNFRTGCNDQETKLTSEYVRANGIQHLADLWLDDPRGTEGQPLVVSGIKMRDGMMHDVVYIADMSNNVYAFDLNTYRLLWKQHVGNPIITTKKDDWWGINPTWGILSTPVINLDSGTLHAVSFSSVDGTSAKGVYTFHSLSLVDGSNQAPPLGLNGATFTPPDGSPAKHIGDTPRKQRPGLSLDVRAGRSTVFVAFGSFAESSMSNQGWVLAIDVTNLKPTIAATWITGWKHPPNAGIWMAGEGLSMNDDGYLFGMTGNGGFSPPTDFGECFFKLKYTPPAGTATAKLECVDHWSPFSDSGAAGQDPTSPNLSQGMAMMMEAMEDMGDDKETFPTNAMNDMVMVQAASNRNPVRDQDLGSGGPLNIPQSLSGLDKEVLIGAGKHGISYTVDANNMGGTTNADFASSKIAGNYAKLLAPPYGFTFYPGDVSLQPTDMATLPILPNGKTAHVHSAPRCYRSPDHGIMIFVGGENGPVRAFKLNADYSMTYLACGQEIASEGMGGAGGMPGSAISLSCNGQGTNTGVLWALMPLNDDANKRVVQGRLVAYAANWVDGNGNLMKLWDSQDWGWQFRHNKFNCATIANGKILVPSYDGRVMIIG